MRVGEKKGLYKQVQIVYTEYIITQATSFTFNSLVARRRRCAELEHS